MRKSCSSRILSEMDFSQINEIRYVKIMNNEDAHNLEKNIKSFLDVEVVAIVLNFVDILAHSRSDLPILKGDCTR